MFDQRVGSEKTSPWWQLLCGRSRCSLAWAASFWDWSDCVISAWRPGCSPWRCRFLHGRRNAQDVAMWGPRSIAKLVEISPITMVYGIYNYNYLGGPNCGRWRTVWKMSFRDTDCRPWSTWHREDFCRVRQGVSVVWREPEGTRGVFLFMGVAGNGMLGPHA